MMKKYLIPAAICLCFMVTYIGISRVNNNDYLFLPVWDIKHYLDISEIGYQVYPCTPGVDGRAGDICGNSGWFPMWPLVVKAARPLLGGSSRTTFIGLTFLFSFASFLLLFRFMDRQYDLKAAILTLLAFALGPASFYLITGFPYALFMMLFILYLFLLYRPPGIRRDAGLFAVAVAISLTYPTGILIGVLPLVWYVFSMRKSGLSPKTTKYWLNLAKYLIPFILGPLLLWTYFYIKFDDFFLQLRFQAKYERTWAFPLWVMLKSLAKQPIYSPENLTILWYGLIFLMFWPFRLKRELWVLGLVMYLFSLTTGTTMSIYRHYLIIFPAYMIIGASARPLWLKLIFIAAGIIISLTILLPLFMAYRLI